MKKIGKLSINSEKIIKNDELVNLKGGTYDGSCLYCWCKNSSGGLLGPAILHMSSADECKSICQEIYSTEHWRCDFNQ